MIKEEILTEYRQFLEELGNSYPLPDSRGTIAGMAERVGCFSSNIEEMNDLMTKKINELLQNANDEDGKELTDLLLYESKLFLKNHLGIETL